MTKSSDQRKQRRAQRRLRAINGGGQSKPPPLQFREAVMTLEQQALANGIKGLTPSDAAVMLLRCAAKSAAVLGLDEDQLVEAATAVFEQEVARPDPKPPGEGA